MVPYRQKTGHGSIIMRVIRTAVVRSIDARIWTPSLLTLHKNQGKRPLLPSLQDLVWDQKLNLKPSFSVLLLFIPSTLRTLRLWLIGGYRFSHEYIRRIESTLAGLLQSLQSQAPSLVAYTLRPFKTFQTWPPQASVSFVAHHNLCRIHLAHSVSIRSLILRALSTLEHLVVLRVMHLTVEGDEQLSPFSYPFLSEFSTSGDIKALTTFFTHVSFPKIERLSLWEAVATRAVLRAEMHHEWLSILQNACSDSIQMLHIHVRTHPSLGNIDRVPVRCDLLAIIRPLFAMYGLRDLRFTISHPKALFSVTDRDIRDMASAWPGMTTLTLDYNSGPTLPTISSLQYFAQLCPDLESLHMSAFRMELSSPLLADGTTMNSNKLQNISFRRLTGKNRRITDQTEMALFLFRTFPLLDSDRLEKCAFQNRQISVQEEGVAMMK
ncbi:uncharacterized protein FIBRA_07486 [Fibroporia radiculosa]|uniref:F-box domain-containing protein n=1 Tax=Fibroporia radiculosa TaxID=599839 RepID=J4H4N0_9APHY|nr:uncharacterized protein FIBRA_07486 [Fibroporia radiculosa]CCM05274.1 predicted protein [Fibroporia radiculosa]